MDLQAEVSIMKMSRRVADIESSSNGEVAVLEELKDVMFQVCATEEGLLFWNVQLVHVPYCCADTGCNIVDLWFEHGQQGHRL